MLEGQFFKEVSNSSTLASPLYKLAEKMPNKEMNVLKLDEPIVKEKEKYEGLNEETKDILKKNGMSENLIESSKLNKETNMIELKTINQNLEGGKHSETDIPYERENIKIGSMKVEGVFPNFDKVSVFETNLCEENITGTDREQFKECNQKLKDTIESNQELKAKFSKEQLEMIENTDTPRGFTWHHDVEIGKMQLVPTDVHNKTAHTGGKALWGGGKENR